MKQKLHIYSFILVFLLSGFMAESQTCEWRLGLPTYNAADPDGVGPATGSVTFTLQIHTVSGTIPNVNVLATGWSYQSAAAMIPTTPGCAVVTNPANVTVSPEFTAAGFTYNVVNQCGVFNQTAGGQNFDRRAVGTLIGTSINLTTTWTDVFTVTLWTLGNVVPRGGYAVINSGSGGTNVPPGIVFNTYSVSDVDANEFPVNSLTYLTPLPLVIGPVPVTFAKYDAKCSDRGTVLSWSTSQEVNTSYFEVEKNIDGSTSWTSIGRLSAAGNSSRLLNYQYVDLEAGAASYRIRQVDLNGRSIYTDVKRTSCEARSINVLVYPIPARDNLTVAIRSSRASKTTLQVVDAAGRIVYKQQNVSINAGSTNVQLDIRTLPAGEYILISSDPSVYIRQKFVIAR